MKFIDLSTPIYNNTLGELPIMAPIIEYSDHDAGIEQMSFIYPKIIPDQHLPLGKGWATETITLGTHSGTHMDAPWHYGPIQDMEIGEKEAMKIDEVPLEWCIGPLIVLDLKDKEDGYCMAPEDIDQKLDEIGHKLQEGDILCLNTNAAKFFGTPKYMYYGAGVGREGTLHIIRQGVHIVGTDAWSWDPPLPLTAKKWKATVKAKEPDPSIIWEGHFAGIELGYFQMEKLTNLDKVPPVGATIYCFPIKITRASAGWVRAVATIPE